MAVQIGFLDRLSAAALVIDEAVAEAGRLAGLGGPAFEKTRKTLRGARVRHIRETLKAAGMDFKDVVSVTAYIANFNEFEKFNAVYREYFPTDPPARATVQVAALNMGAKIELQMIAVKP